MLGAIESGHNWQWAAFGKHPAAKDYFRVGKNPVFVEGMFGWVESGYQNLIAKSDSTPDYCSWRFWASGNSKDTLVCGVVRVSSDSLGRPYPLVIMGSGPLKGWEDNWDLLPLACEKTWCQIEYLAAHMFTDFKKLENEVERLRTPSSDWRIHSLNRRELNRIGSPLDPYASFLDLDKLKQQASSISRYADMFVSLDRGPCNDKIIHVSLWHLLFKNAYRQLPTTVFIGGTLEKACLGIFKRPLKAADFIQLWSVSIAGLWKNMIGTEYSMDLSALGKQPVSADKPAGMDVRYDPAFDELQTEVDKLSSPAAAGAVNWEKVVRFASDILANKSKDMLVASYLAVGLIYTRQNDGFAIGLKIYLDLMEKYWVELYPPQERMRGRIRSIEWWLEKAEVALKQLQPASFTSEQLAQINDSLDKLSELLRENLNDAPSLTPFKKFFSALTVVVGAAQAAEEQGRQLSKPAEGDVTVAKQEESGDLEEMEILDEIASMQEAHKLLNDGLQKMRDASYHLRQEDSSNPLAYRLIRNAVWYGVEELPPAVEGRTRIPPPAAQEKNMLFGLRDNGDAEALLKAAEARLPQFIFWLDLNRLVTEALSRLGSRFGKAHEAVCQETAFLLHRLPGLVELAFSDGTPFANPETRQWLKGILLREGVSIPQSESDVGSATKTSSGAVMEKEIEAANMLIRKGKLLEAMEGVQQKLRSGSSRKEKLIWRLALSRMLISADKIKFALPHLEEVLTDINRHGLEEYEPILALQGLKLAWQAFESQPEPKFKERAAEALHRIGRLDMPEMVRLAKG